MFTRRARQKEVKIGASYKTDGVWAREKIVFVF